MQDIPTYDQLMQHLAAYNGTNQDFPTTPPARGAPGERNPRVIPQKVKIEVSVRDQGKCVQCGSTDDLHFDHKVPWSRGGTNTVNKHPAPVRALQRAQGRRRHSVLKHDG